jgi:hypothetical protein
MGTQLLSYFNLGKEVTPGTSVAATRQLSPSMDSVFQVDFMQNFHENRTPGRRNPINYATSMGTLVNIAFQTDSAGIAFNNLQTFFQFPDGSTATGSAGTATWTHSGGGTAAGNFVTYTAEYGDNIQEYESEYVFAKEWGISADVGGMTQLTATMVGRQSTKSTATALNMPSPIRIPSFLWAWKHASTQAGIAGASFLTAQLKSFDLQVTTGITEAKYLSGVAYYDAASEKMPFGGQLHLVVSHVSGTITELYDNAVTGTPTFFQLAATGPYITGVAGTQYSASITGCWIPEKVTPLGTTIDGETMIDVTGPLAYDDTWGKSLQTVVVNSVNTYM